MRPGFEIIPHTADIGLRVRGKTLAALFENAARGMTSLLAEMKGTGREKSANVRLSSDGPESLLVDWLGEILYKFTVKRAAYSRFKVTALSPRALSARLSGGRAGPGLRALREIKAVTYHGLKIKKMKEGYAADIIFDV
ncbi:MAG: hypothetical protein A2636_03785 [Elusimicrobia bacterium RIFCSPHIGHO2_01_FULL_64_10]|nr:MAG: hypothetical protein A2636_03785 [Elusimicrobia bacterium RIFCSPHIGHO2_01_FULL_64_10]